MRALRIAITLLVVAALAWFFFLGVRGKSKAPDVAPPAVPATGTGAFPPMAGQPTTEAAKPRPPAPALPTLETPPGTPVKSDAAVSIHVPYRVGTKGRYRVTESSRWHEQKHQISTWRQWEWTIATEVLRADADDVAVRFQIESFRFRTDAPGVRIEFDSENPDSATLETEQLAREIRPWMAVRKMPVEAVFAPGGAVKSVLGVDAMQRKYLEAVEIIRAQLVAEATEAPSVETFREKFGDLFFPPVGVGSMKASDRREATFTTTYFDRWAAATAGRFRVTHDDPDVFRLEFKGTPAITELNRPAMGRAARAIEKLNVQANADAYAASWRFDRRAGRLVSGDLSAKYVLWVSQRVGNGVFDAFFWEIERLTKVELLGE